MEWNTLTYLQECFVLWFLTSQVHIQNDQESSCNRDENLNYRRPIFAKTNAKKEMHNSMTFSEINRHKKNQQKIKDNRHIILQHIASSLYKWPFNF